MHDNPLYTGHMMSSGNFTSPTGSENSVEETAITTQQNHIEVINEEDEISPVIKSDLTSKVTFRKNVSGSKLRRRSVDSGNRKSKEFQEDLKNALKKRPISRESNNSAEVICHNETQSPQHKRRRRNRQLGDSNLYHDVSALDKVPRNMMLSDL